MIANYILGYDLAKKVSLRIQYKSTLKRNTCYCKTYYDVLGNFERAKINFNLDTYANIRECGFDGGYYDHYPCRHIAYNKYIKKRYKHCRIFILSHELAHVLQTYNAKQNRHESHTERKTKEIIADKVAYGIIKKVYRFKVYNS